VNAAERARDRRLRSTYNISADEYDLILAAQDGLCAICRRPPPESGTRFAVDHDHKTGLVRGLLCYPCNRFLVGRHTQPGLLQAAADYLSHPPAIYALRGPRFGVIGPARKRRRRRR
jgi:hypothetical protein